VPITKNCHDALTSLVVNSKIRTIWVDAICIDQSDDAEKSGQIPLMSDIYGKAKRVHIWLGNGTEDSDYAFDWLSDVSQDQTGLTVRRVMDFYPVLDPGEALKMTKLFLYIVGRGKNCLQRDPSLIFG
jgi:hypothetical protein